jgi:hypothetical protein
MNRVGTRVPFGITLFLLAVLLESGCGGPSGVSEKQAVELAAKALMGKPGFDRTVPVSVRRLPDRYTVMFRFPVPGGRPGQTYHSFVAIEARTGEVLELGVEEDPQSAAAAPPSPSEDAPASRPTPLREEVDEVAKLQKQMGR